MRIKFPHHTGRRIALLTVSLVLLGLVPPSGAYAATWDSEEASLCQQINTYRAQNGLGALLVSTSLTNAAEWLSADMAQKNYFSHIDSLGRDPSRRMTDFGYSNPTKAENIAAGNATASATLAQWKASVNHNATLLSTSYTVMGLGRAYSATSTHGWYWTGTFGGLNDGGTPCPSSAPPVLTVNDVSATEGNAGNKAFTFTVGRSGNTTGTSSVQYATANNTAIAGSDYAALALTTLTFSPGQTSRTVSVSVIGDTLVEPSESFFLKLSTPAGATISDASGTATIQNDDSDPTTSVAVNDVALTEGNAGTKSFVFTLTRSGNTAGTSSVQYATANGTAVAGSDYAAVPLTTLTFGPGEVTRYVGVTVTGDTTAEAREIFYLRLSSPAGATISDSSGTATIQNDDGPPRLQVNGISFGEGNVGTKTATFTVSRSDGDMSGTSSVSYATANGTAIAGSDYVAIPPTTLTFGPGETTKPVVVTIINDTVPEPQETFYLNLSAPAGATIFDGSGTATMHDTDA